jgi:hypothetical protein
MFYDLQSNLVCLEGTFEHFLGSGRQQKVIQTKVRVWFSGQLFKDGRMSTSVTKIRKMMKILDAIETL